jgi:hypothetical protein
VKKLLTFALLTLVSAYGFAADEGRNFHAVYTVFGDPASGYPSTFIRVPLDTFQPTTVQPFEPHSSPADYLDEGRWHIRKIGPNDKEADPEIPIRQIVMFGDPTKWTSSVLIYLDENAIGKGDKLNVGVDTTYRGVPTRFVDYDSLASKLTLLSIPANPPRNKLDFDPSIKQDQKMLDGSKETVGELSIKGKVWLAGTPKPIYANVDSIVSSSSDDVAGKFDIRIGTKKFIPDTYIPVFLETGIITNQRFSNSSFVATLGFDDIILPLGITYGVGYYDAGRDDLGKQRDDKRKISIAPHMRLGVQYAHQFKRDNRVETAHALQNTFRVVGTFELVRLYLGRLQKGPNANVILTANATGWYFPNEKATGGFKVRHFEGVFDAGLTFEIRKDLAFKLTWTTGAQEANNFVRTSTFGFTFVKLS